MKVKWLIILLILISFLNAENKKFLDDEKCHKAYLYHFLERSCWYGDEIGVRILLAHGADPNGKGYFNDYPNCVGPFEFTSPLFSAVSSGHIEITKILLNSGANPNILEGEGVTPLVAAVENGYVELVKLLLKYGAKVEINGLVDMPLDLAKQKGFKEIIKLLEGNKNK